MCWVNEWMISWAPVSLHTTCFSVLLPSKNSLKCTFSHCIFHSLHCSPLCLSIHPKYLNMAYRLFIIHCYVTLWNHLLSIFHLHPLLNWLPGLSMLDFLKNLFIPQVWVQGHLFPEDMSDHLNLHFPSLKYWMCVHNRPLSCMWFYVIFVSYVWAGLSNGILCCYKT